MRSPEYLISKREDGVLEIIVLVSRYDYIPEGSFEDWVKYAEEKAVEGGWGKVHLYKETQDKQTGHCNLQLIHKIGG